MTGNGPVGSSVVLGGTVLCFDWEMFMGILSLFFNYVLYILLICGILLSFFKLVKTLEVGKIAIVQNNSKGKREIIKISK